MLRSSLDGKNLEVVLLEFGIRLHRVIYDHIQQFSINEIGVCVCVCVCACACVRACVCVWCVGRNLVHFCHGTYVHD